MLQGFLTVIFVVEQVAVKQLIQTLTNKYIACILNIEFLGVHVLVLNKQADILIRTVLITDAIHVSINNVIGMSGL